MKRYLIVDDKRNANMLMSEILSDMGDGTEDTSFSLEVARTPLEGYAALSKSLIEKRYDVLFLDHDLGAAESGFDILKTILGECFTVHGEVDRSLFDNLPKKIVCVSSNPPGRANIEALVETIEKMRSDHERKES